MIASWSSFWIGFGVGVVLVIGLGALITWFVSSWHFI